MSGGAREWSRCRDTATRVLDAVDWQALGEIYFHDDGAARWRDRRADLERLGFELARRLAAHVTNGGVSFWCGAGVAELPVLLAETAVLGRQVVVVNANEAECGILNAALAAAAPDAPIRYVAADARERAGEPAFDHVGCISVFTDPETWPTLSGVAYGRLPPVQVDVERFVAEREQARDLARALFARLPPGGWVTTTAEEVSWFLEQAAAAGREFDADEELVETAVVGDPVGFLRLG